MVIIERADCYEAKVKPGDALICGWGRSRSNILHSNKKKAEEKSVNSEMSENVKIAVTLVHYRYTSICDRIR